MDDFIFAHKPRLLDVVAQLMEVQPTRSLGFGYKLCAVIPVAGQRTHRTTLSALKVTFQVATTEAECAVYDCLVMQYSSRVLAVMFIRTTHLYSLK